MRSEIHFPGQKFGHFITGPLRQYAQDMTQISPRVDSVEFARTDQAVQQCAALTTMVAAEEDIIFFPQTDDPQRPFRCVIVRFRQPLIGVITQRIPLVQRLRERFTQPGFFRQRRAFIHHPLME